MPVEVGQAFLIPSGPSHDPDQKHMFVACTQIDADGNILLASISSWKNDLCDATCRLETGCHPFITKDSYVLYRKSLIEASATIEHGIQSGRIKELANLDALLLERILKGMAKSKQTPWKIVRYVRRNVGT
jgi:hypothetical protein